MSAARSTLTGAGVLALSDSPNNRIFATGSDSLTNDVNHTIQGSGQFGINNSGFGFTLTNNGTILANQSNALNIAPSGATTNNGTFQANSGSTLSMNGTLTNYDPGTSALTGGTYKAFSGTIQLSQANTGTGAVIATNAATILLDGPSAHIADGGGNDILQGFFTTNGAAGNFTIQNGRNLTSAASSDFTNAGAMTIGASSTFTVGGSQNYVQSGGLTKVNGTLTATSVALTGGTLNGTGSVSGSVMNTGGTVMPGDPPGILIFDNDYTQGTGGALDTMLGGTAPGTQYSQLLVDQQATLAGALDLTLVSGFHLATGQTFDILGTGDGLANGTTSLSLDGQTCAADGTNMYKCQVGSFFDIFTEITVPGMLVSGANPMDLVLNVTVTGMGAVPEPSTWTMMAIGFASLGFAAGRRLEILERKTALATLVLRSKMVDVGARREFPLQINSTRSPAGPGTSAMCAQRTAGFAHACPRFSRCCRHCRPRRTDTAWGASPDRRRCLGTRGCAKDLDCGHTGERG